MEPSCRKEDVPECVLLGLFLLKKLLAVSADMKIIAPNLCSIVQTLLNKKKDRKRVVAFLAVDVMDMVKAPKCFVIAALHEPPKNPAELNKTITPIFPGTVQDAFSKDVPSITSS